MLIFINNSSADCIDALLTNAIASSWRHACTFKHAYR